MTFKKIFFTMLFFLFNSNVVNAKIFQILHTNDTHSYLDKAPHSTDLGGAARLKSLIDFYKNKMNDDGVKTLVMDAGDFMEGNLYYLADQGRSAFDVHNEMGYDVGVLGNHDYLMGTHDLDKLLGEIDLKFSFVAANIQMNYNFKNIRTKVKPFQEFEIDGIKIGVLGLTTNEVFYKWRLEGGIVLNPYIVARQYENILKQRKNDFIIALTHIGVLNDIKLAEKTKYIDLIVGGHSHTALFKPSYGINKAKQMVPIVQAGLHTEYLGRLVVDLVKGEPLKIISYELIPVKNEESDPGIKSIVKKADNDLEITYGKKWLDEKIGFSDLKANDKDGSRKWAYFITDSMKEKAHTDIAIHTPLMSGENFPVGEITRRDLFNSIPRVFDLSEKFGWTIYTTQIKGMWLRLVFETLMHFGQPLTFSGITMEIEKNNLGLNYKSIRINGEPVNPFKYYSVAFTEGIVRGAAGVSSHTANILHNPQNTNFLIWNTLEEKVVENGNRLSLNKVNEENHFLLMPNN